MRALIENLAWLGQPFSITALKSQVLKGLPGWTSYVRAGYTIMQMDTIGTKSYRSKVEARWKKTEASSKALNLD